MITGNDAGITPADPRRNEDDPVHDNVWSDVADEDGVAAVHNRSGRTVTVLDIRGVGGADAAGTRRLPCDVNAGDEMRVTVRGIRRVRGDWPRIAILFQYKRGERRAVAVFRVPEQIRLSGLRGA